MVVYLMKCLHNSFPVFPDPKFVRIKEGGGVFINGTVTAQIDWHDITKLVSCYFIFNFSQPPVYWDKCFERCQVLV